MYFWEVLVCQGTPSSEESTFPVYCQYAILRRTPQIPSIVQYLQYESSKILGTVQYNKYPGCKNAKYQYSIFCAYCLYLIPLVWVIPITRYYPVVPAVVLESQILGIAQYDYSQYHQYHQYQYMKIQSKGRSCTYFNIAQPTLGLPHEVWLLVAL